MFGTLSLSYYSLAILYLSPANPSNAPVSQSIHTPLLEKLYLLKSSQLFLEPSRSNFNPGLTSLQAFDQDKFASPLTNIFSEFNFDRKSEVSPPGFHRINLSLTLYDLFLGTPVESKKAMLYRTSHDR